MLEGWVSESWGNPGKTLENKEKRLRWSEPRKKMGARALQSMVLGVPKTLEAVSSCCSQVKGHHSQWEEEVLSPSDSVSLQGPLDASALYSPLPVKSYSSLGSRLIQKATCTYAVIVVRRNHNCLLTYLYAVLYWEHCEGTEVVFLPSVTFLAPDHGGLALTITFATFIEWNN